jgi:diaminopropionate ammonia-lyase
MLLVNERATNTPYPAHLRSIMSAERAQEDRRWLSAWTQLSHQATPLVGLPALAARLGVAAIDVKDESVRSPLGSFKALGAPIALVRLTQRILADRAPSAEELFGGRYAGALEDFTVISATDGNHGRALAAAARSIGCRCVIVLHANVSIEREVAIADHGASIERISGNYDDSVAKASSLAAARGWQIVSDTSYDGYELVPRDVMQGYAIIAAEVIEASAGGPSDRSVYSHVFIQGGVGGLAAGVGSYFWEIHGPNRPKFVVVEPRQADCLMQSARLGRAARATGSVDSVMAGLACGEASPLAWQFLEPLADYFLTISDDAAVSTMRLLAAGARSDMPLLAGESGAAGLAGLMDLIGDDANARRVGLDAASRILLINTEGATAPDVYARLAGESADCVLARQIAWKRRRDPRQQ